ncbi:MAG: hypothetical protein D6766_12705, partial [Verrucomicrobia bacterium]
AAGDWIVIAAYLAGIVLLGLWLGRGQRDTRDFFLGGRRLPWWGVGLAIVATETSALTFLGVPAMAFGGDLSFLQIILGYVLARVVLAWWLVPHYFRGEVYSPYELFQRSFGESARRTAAALFLVAGTLAAGVRVYVTCIPVQLMLGFEESGILWAILLFIGLSLAYTAVGGVRSVVWTDAVQFVLLVGGGLFALAWLAGDVAGGWLGGWETAAAGGKLHWFNPRFALGAPFNIWMGVFGGTAQVMASHGADQLIVQRVLSCGSVREGRKALILSAVLILPLMALFLLVGVFLWVHRQQAGPPAIPIPEARPGVGKNDYVFPIYILTQMPAGVRGLLIVGVLSAAMSSVSAALAALASVSTMDFLKPWLRKPRSERWLLRVSRASTVGWAALLALVAWWTREAVSVLNVAFALNGLTSGPLLGGLALAVLRRRFPARAVVAGMLGGFTVMVAVYTWGREAIFWPWYTLLGATVTLALAAAMAAFTRGGPRPAEVAVPAEKA